MADPAEVQAHLGLVHRTAQRLAYLGRGLLDYNDLVDFGVFGLIAALDNYDPNRNPQAKFSSYAIPCIRGHILEECRKFFQTRQSRKWGVTALSLPSEVEEDLQPLLGDEGKAAQDLQVVLEAKAFWDFALPLLLPRQQWLIRQLLAGRTQASCAEELGITASAINLQYKKALSRLRQVAGTRR